MHMTPTTTRAPTPATGVVGEDFYDPIMPVRRSIRILFY